jgi:predicted NBD/HSP70 family sugar kinase
MGRMPKTKFSIENTIGGNSVVVRRINRSKILNIIRENQPVSRIQIAQQTRLNKSTVSSIVSELLADHLVFEEYVKGKKVGRNPIQLRLKTGQHYCGAINIDAGLCRIAVADINGQIVQKELLPGATCNADLVLKLCREKLDSMSKKINSKRLIGIGITVAGIVKRASGQVVWAPNLGWQDVNVKANFMHRLNNQPLIIVENDARAAGLAEAWLGNPEIKKFSGFVYVSVGMGLGTGIIDHNKIISGYHSAAGEFGHMTIVVQGKQCQCGNYGCWEAYASDRATLERFNQQESEPPVHSVREIITLARARNRHAIDVLRQTGQYLGLGISNIVKVLDPEAVIIGGDITQAWDIINPEIQKAVTERAFFGFKKSHQILSGSLQECARLEGAVTVVLKEFFSTLN